MNKIIAALASVLIIAGMSASVYSDGSVQKTPTIIKHKQLSIEERIEAYGNYTKMQVALDYLISRQNITPYVFSGNTPRGWDCSGMVDWLYERFGLTLPHSADDLAHIGERISNPVAGDIVVMAYKGRTDFYHAGIYLGNNLIVDANRFYNTTVVESLNEYKHSQIRFVRVVNLINPDTTVKPLTDNCWSKYETEYAAILNCEKREK